VARPIIRPLAVQDRHGVSHNPTVGVLGRVATRRPVKAGRSSRALAQDRYVQRRDLQTIGEILATPMAAQVCAEVAVRRSQELDDSPQRSFLLHAHSASVKAP
jgi:hypothetical protein